MWKFDGWKNLLTGLGVKGQDGRADTFASWNRMSWDEVENLYSSDELATKVVEYLPEEMLRKEFKYSHEQAEPSFNEEMNNYLKEFKVKEKFLEAMKQARLYGEAYVLMGIDDGQDHSEPLDVERIRKLDWCQVFHKWQLTVNELGTDVRTEYFKKPETYRLVEVNDDDVSVVHASRLIKFIGSNLPHQLYIRNYNTHDSVLNKVKNSLANYNTACDSLASTLHEFSLGVFKMKGLAKLVGAGKESQVVTRMGLINAKKSIVRAIVLDGDEDFKREHVSLTGMPESIKVLGNKLVADTNMPHTVILGEGPSSTLGSGGDSENNNWYNYVARKQEAELEPNLIKIGKVLLKANGKEIPAGLDVDFESLFEMSDTQKADIRLKTSQADSSDILNQILDPDEVALSRYGSGKYSLDTKINNDLRKTPDKQKENTNNNGEF